MALLVQKFGGTSLGSVARIETVADIIQKTIDNSNQVVIVVSAMAGETDRLLNLASQITHDASPRELDVLLSTGEQVSIALLALALLKRNIKAKSYTGGQVYILTNSNHTDANIIDINLDNIKQDLQENNIIPIIAGFQGIDKNNNITTFGRGGSDVTAVALAAALNANECQIYTDVDGVYTADPRIINDARLINIINSDIMLEMSSEGAKVLQYKAAYFAKQYNIPVRILSSFTSHSQGTLISCKNKDTEKTFISGLAVNKNIVLFTISNIPIDSQINLQIAQILSANHIIIDMFVQNIFADLIEVSFIVDSHYYNKTCLLLDSLLNKNDCKYNKISFVNNPDIAKISLIGLGVKCNTEIISTVFAVLSKHNININLFSSTEIKVSLCIAEEKLREATKLLHKAFSLDEKARVV